MFLPSFAKSMLPLFFISLFFTSCSSASSKDKSTEPDLSEAQVRQAKVNAALSFVNAYVANCNKMKEAVDVVKWTNASELATPAFKKELKRMDEEAWKQDPEMGLDADPIFDAQDYPDKGFELEHYNDHSDFLMLKGINWTEFTLYVKVISVKDKYLVDGCGMVNIPADMRRKQN